MKTKEELEKMLEAGEATKTARGNYVTTDGEIYSAEGKLIYRVPEDE